MLCIRVSPRQTRRFRMLNAVLTYYTHKTAREITLSLSKNNERQYERHYTRIVCLHWWKLRLRFCMLFIFVKNVCRNKITGPWYESNTQTARNCSLVRMECCERTAYGRWTSTHKRTAFARNKCFAFARRIKPLFGQRQSKLMHGAAAGAAGVAHSN